MEIFVRLFEITFLEIEIFGTECDFYWKDSDIQKNFCEIYLTEFQKNWHFSEISDGFAYIKLEKKATTLELSSFSHYGNKSKELVCMHLPI